MRDVLREFYGFADFRENQEAIIKNILQKRDVFAVMPTGGGKSLCYQLPSKLLKGTVVVISPLISLMKDQVDAAIENGFSAAYLNSSLSVDEVYSIYRRIHAHSLELLYVAPERVAMAHFFETLRTVPIALFAVDEAHCISEWGHDFRPDYMGLSAIAVNFKDIPIAAFTATATAQVQEDIIRKLGLRDPFVVRASFDRKNLFYRVEKKIDVEKQVLRFVREHAGVPGIIYRATRDSAEVLSNFLSKNGIRALPYHAGLSAEERTRNQNAFSKDEADVIVGTIAFGMGIDKSNVRFVIHADLPKHIEGYYQETGRAGRDGEPSECVLYYTPGDAYKIRYFINQVEDEAERLTSEAKLAKMILYASANVCRRRQLLGYLGEKYKSQNCGTCDVCVGVYELRDITTDAQIIMSAISRTGQRFGRLYIIDIVLGKGTKRVTELQHDKIKTFGAGKHKGKDYWRAIFDELLVQELLVQEGDKYPVIKLSQHGKSVLFGKESVMANMRPEIRADIVQQVSRTEAGSHFEEFDHGLFERLRALRRGIADEQEVAPFIVFSDKTLHEMCRYYPTTIDQLWNINGVGQLKIDRYGDEFIKEIKGYLEMNPDIRMQYK
ncbi:DNA helicase RecQ [Candidatus Magnetominusculus dajiuhuensis]|uniref:DNA helicase RecQ n=1 Tax=Candidatus Magnetominusculus dajiuhuensis TaxID=3137712 RepID=UPI003B43B0F3